MPELPEVETVRAQLEPALVGRRFVRVEIDDPRLVRPFEPREIAAELEGERDHSRQLLADNERLQQLVAHRPLRYRLADRLNHMLKRVPLAHGVARRLVAGGAEVREC